MVHRNHNQSSFFKVGQGSGADAERDSGGQGEARLQDGLVQGAAGGPRHHALADHQHRGQRQGERSEWTSWSHDSSHELANWPFLQEIQ